MPPQTLLTLDDTLLNHQRFQVTDDVLYRQVENEAILLHIPAGVYYSLNETSIYFWEALQNQQPLNTAIDKITTEYDVEQSQVLNDLQVFLTDLTEYGLISMPSEN